MKTYSASEAVWPALLRTYNFALRPMVRRKWKIERFLKVAALATVCEGLIVSLRFAVPHTMELDHHWDRARTLFSSSTFLPVTILGALALVILAIYLLLVVTQLRFAFFHCLVHFTHRIGRVSKNYRNDAERLFTATAIVWLCFLVLGVLALMLFAAAGYTVFNLRTPDGKLDPGHFLFLFFPCLGIAVVLLLALFFAHVVLIDLMLPHMAIEGAGLQKAWDEVRVRVAAYRETFLSYFFLRLVLTIAGALLMGLCAWICSALLFGLLGMSAAGFEAMLDGAGGVRAVLLIAADTIFDLVGILLGFTLTVTFSGLLGIFIRSYALYFYGGYYKPLGNLLEPFTSKIESVEASSKFLPR